MTVGIGVLRINGRSQSLNDVDKHLLILHDLPAHLILQMVLKPYHPDCSFDTGSQYLRNKWLLDKIHCIHRKAFGLDLLIIIRGKEYNRQPAHVTSLIAHPL